jgi:hypothetical protein
MLIMSFKTKKKGVTKKFIIIKAFTKQLKIKKKT